MAQIHRPKSCAFWFRVKVCESDSSYWAVVPGGKWLLSASLLSCLVENRGLLLGKHGVPIVRNHLLLTRWSILWNPDQNDDQCRVVYFFIIILVQKREKNVSPSFDVFLLVSFPQDYNLLWLNQSNRKVMFASRGIGS